MMSVLKKKLYLTFLDLNINHQYTCRTNRFSIDLQIPIRTKHHSCCECFEKKNATDECL